MLTLCLMPLLVMATRAPNTRMGFDRWDAVIDEAQKSR
jgi:hypothetical protein